MAENPYIDPKSGVDTQPYVTFARKLFHIFVKNEAITDDFEREELEAVALLAVAKCLNKSRFVELHEAADQPNAEEQVRARPFDYVKTAVNNSFLDHRNGDQSQRNWHGQHETVDEWTFEGTYEDHHTDIRLDAEAVEEEICRQAATEPNGQGYRDPEIVRLLKLGHTHEEIGRLIQASSSSVSRRIARIRKNMRARFPDLAS